MAGVLATLSSAALASEAVIVPKTMKIVIPYATGGSTDLLARQLANGLSKRFGITVISENRPGGGSMIGTAFVAKAPADGTTLLLTTTAFTIGAGIQDKLPYDPINDLLPVAMLTQVPMILAVPATSSFRTTADFINAARAKPGSLNYGSSGIGTSNHMAMELFKAAAKIQLVHVPYKGMSPAATDLAGGQVQAIIGSYSSLAGMLQSGKVRALAVSSLNASPFSPDLPAISALVPGFGITAWFGVFAPRGTPTALVELLHNEIKVMIRSEEFTKFFIQERAEASQIDLPTMRAQIQSEITQWKRIAVEQNIKPE
jgi:tripartite-type tricarboxylate transporter receptor subunit TctC